MSKVMGELRNLNVPELETRLLEAKAGLSKARAVVAAGTKPEKTGNIRDIRKKIARVLTLLRQKSLKEKTGTLKVSAKPVHAAAGKEKMQAARPAGKRG